jgi:hypothetical protein
MFHRTYLSLVEVVMGLLVRPDTPPTQALLLMEAVFDCPKHTSSYRILTTSWIHSVMMIFLEPTVASWLFAGTCTTAMEDAILSALYCCAYADDHACTEMLFCVIAGRGDIQIDRSPYVILDLFVADHANMIDSQIPRLACEDSQHDGHRLVVDAARDQRWKMYLSVLAPAALTRFIGYMTPYIDRERCALVIWMCEFALPSVVHDTIVELHLKLRAMERAAADCASPVIRANTVEQLRYFKERLSCAQDAFDRNTQ